MALRKQSHTHTGYDLAPDEDFLRPLIQGERYYEQADGDHSVVVSSGVRETMAWWVILHQLYTEQGCFRDIVQEHNVPRIMAMVKLKDEPIALAMLVNSSRYLGTAYMDHAPSVGFLGMFVKPDHRGHGVSAMAMKWVGLELQHLIAQCAQPPQDPCVQSNWFIRKWASKNFYLPVFAI